MDDIKNRLIPLDTPDEIADVLMEQAAAVKRKIESLSESLRELEVLREEVLQMQSVDFKKYADIIVNLQMKNDFYWLIKHFDDQTLDHIRSRFDKDSGMAFMNTFIQLQDEAIRLQNAGVPVDSDEGQSFAKAYWDMITDFTGGDMSMLPKLIELGQFQNTDHEWKEKQDIANGYIGQALTRNPDILFLDEPTAGLDVEGRLSLHEQIRQLKAIGKTIILVSHESEKDLLLFLRSFLANRESGGTGM